jgi:hypothetical protein
MGYLHIENLYKNQLILLFKECYALEKIHGTSANISWATHSIGEPQELKFHAGGESHARFVSLFDAEAIKKTLIDTGFETRRVTVYGEAYGGKQQGMSDTYGKELKFIAFDVCLDENHWLNVPEAEAFCKTLGIEFVHYVKVSTDLKELDAQRDMYSIQAIRNGVSSYGPSGSVINPKPREGVVLRPLIELSTSTGNRMITKHKGDAFRETASPRVVDDPNKLKVLEDATNIANEWVTMNRMEHVLQKLPGHDIKMMPVIINAMVEDVTREAKGEIVDNDATRKAIRAKTVAMYKEYLNNKLRA